MPGSNTWAISPQRSKSMQPMLASDPHLALSSPNIFHLVVLKTLKLKSLVQPFLVHLALLLGAMQM